MATAALNPSENIGDDKRADFPLMRLKAPFILRCAALFIDYLILLIVPVIWLIIGKILNDNAIVVIPGWIWAIAVILFICNFLILPFLRGRTVGKILLGLTILNTDGTPLRLGGVLKRNILGYFITLLTGGLGFLLGAVNSSGRAVHDLIAGTVVVIGRKTEL